MREIQEQFVATARGGILYDAARIVKPADELFERGVWAAKNALEEVRGGRGSIAILHAGEEQWVLRHYRRGGWIASVAQDRYLWTGASRTRSVAEWRLLAALVRRSLPVPAPVAARFVRSGLFYRADLITERLHGVRTLAQALAGEAPALRVWREVGAVIARFHQAGVQHADLNAHNILLTSMDGAPPVYLLDFDRGRIRARGSWERQVLKRLRRSLDKIKRTHCEAAFGRLEWEALLEGYGKGDG